MKLKIGLYIGFFVLFTLVFSQLAFPFRATVENIRIISADSEASMAVFADFAGDGPVDPGDRHLIEYEVAVESTRLVPIDILGNRILAGEQWEERILAKATEPEAQEVRASMPSGKVIRLLVDTTGLSREEIHEMAKDIDIHIHWSFMQGWERENKAFLPSDRRKG